MIGVSLVIIAATALLGLAVRRAWGADTRITGTATIVDGDTIDLGPVLIRLHGIDAPEAGQRCGTANGGTWLAETAPSNASPNSSKARQWIASPGIVIPTGG